MKRSTLIMLFLMSVPAAIFAQEPTPTTLSQLFENANSYPGLKAEKEDLEVAKLHQKIVKREFLPEVQVQAQNTYGTYEGAMGGFFPTTGIFNISGDGVAGHTAVNTLISATAEWKFLQFGEHRDKVKIAEIESEIATNDIVLKELELQHKITALYLQWQYAQYMLQWARNEAYRNGEIFRMSSSLVENGLTSAADSLLAKSTLEQALAQQHQWNGRTFHYANKIQEYTGVFLGKENLVAAFFNPAQASFSSEEAEIHPLLVTKEKQVQKLSIRKKKLTHQVLPDVSLLAGGLLRGVGFSEEGNAWEESYALPINNYLVGLGITWDISGFFSKGLKTQSIAHRKKQFRAEREVIERRLEEERESLQHQLQQSLQEISAVEDAYEAAKKSYELFKVRYEHGLIDMTALLQIQQTLRFTEKARIAAYYDYWRHWNNYAYMLADFSLLTNVFH